MKLQCKESYTHENKWKQCVFFLVARLPFGENEDFQLSGSYFCLMLLRQKSWSADSSGWFVLWQRAAVVQRLCKPRALQCGGLWDWALQVWPRCLWAFIAPEQVSVALAPAPGVRGVSGGLWGEQWQQEEQAAKGGWGCGCTFCVWVHPLPNQWMIFWL